MALKAGVPTAGFDWCFLFAPLDPFSASANSALSLHPADLSVPDNELLCPLVFCAVQPIGSLAGNWREGGEGVWGSDSSLLADQRSRSPWPAFSTRLSLGSMAIPPLAPSAPGWQQSHDPLSPCKPEGAAVTQGSPTPCPHLCK